MQGLRAFIERHRNASIAVGGLIAVAVIGCCLIGLLTDTTERSPAPEERGAAAVVSEATETSYPTEEPTATSKPTESPLPTETATAAPTSTPYPTATPVPTQEPTHRPEPTNTPEPTDTAAPSPTATLAPGQAGGRVETQVVEVVDGDTIKVNVGGEAYTVRYIGIDCPETKHPDEPVEWMGPEASQANRELVGGRTVYLEKDISETDQYGRLLRYVFLASGMFVNAELVKQGYAQVSTYPPDVKYQDLFLEMQQEARENERGLWGPTLTPMLPSPTPAPATATSAPATEAPAGPGKVQITYVYYDGQVPRVESDEYAVIKNVGGSPVNLGGWRLNAGDPGQDFVFPNFELQPGHECRVYTNEDHAESCGFNFHSGRALWNNKGDCGHLYDASGAEVSTYCY